MIRTMRDQGLEIAIDLTPQRLHLDIEERDHGFKLRCIDEEHSDDDDNDPSRVPPDLVPSPVAPSDHLTSAALLGLKAKHVEDRVIAAIKLLLQRGTPKTMGKRALLERWAARLFAGRRSSKGDAVEVLLAACRLGNIESPAVPRDLDRAVSSRVRRFLADPVRSMPLGFHTDSPELEDAYRQNRMLQTALEDTVSIGAAARALHGDPALLKAYRAHMRARSRLTNPPKRPSLRPLLRALDRDKDALAKPCALSPPLVAPEDAIVRALAFGGARPGFDVLSEAIRQIRAGELDLAPGPSSGFYQHQWWAAAPLAHPDPTPERARLEWSSSYRSHLEALFRAAIALARETHVEDLDEEEEAEDDEVEEERVVVIRPHLTVEPLPTHYLRRAAGHRFLMTMARSMIGEAMDEPPRDVPGWPEGRSIREELAALDDLFTGAAATAFRELGRPPREEAQGDASAVERFAGFCAARARDHDLGRDARMMVPVSITPEGAVRVWMFLGYRRLPLRVSFTRRPLPRVVPSPGGAPTVRWEYAPSHYTIACPIVVEGIVPTILNRPAFRKVCDRARSVGAILRAVKCK